MTITKEKAERIAREYADTGFLNKSVALVNAGYSESYAKGGRRDVVYRNEQVRNAIDNLIKEEEKRYTISREIQMKRLENTIIEANKDKSHSAVVSAIREMNEMLGYHRETAPNPEKELAKKALIDSEIKLLQEIARERTLALSKPVESKVIE